MRITAITGGIGSGKSVVSRILSVMGYPVYDCDLTARRIMDADKDIHRQLCSAIHPRAVVDGVVDRPLISSVVFSDKDALSRLNAIVHEAVRNDIMDQAEHLRQSGEQRFFVETAIPRSGNIDSLVDDIWQVVADEDVRISRVVKRSHLSPQQIKARIEAQKTETVQNVVIQQILNNPESELLPQIHSLLNHSV